ncbi:MAG: hypothetical protein GXO71_07505 [Caldiserica bacterium]|nr:hypothetical protein [Caldisericota bacterium]
MIIQCAWCKEIVGEKEPLQDKRVTSTICPECFKKLKKEIEERKRKEKKTPPGKTQIAGPKSSQGKG